MRQGYLPYSTVPLPFKPKLVGSATIIRLIFSTPFVISIFDVSIAIILSADSTFQ
jgi:hypothetical protein